MLIIIKGRQRLGKSRSEIETNLHKEWGAAGLSHEQIDKCAFAEKRTGRKWFDKEIVDVVDKVRERLMSGGVAETLRDTDPMFQGTHKGGSGLTLSDLGADFKSCGAKAGLAIYNVTDVSNGLIVSVTEDSIVTTLSGGSLNVWTSGDIYRIYKTATYNSVISTNYVDRRYGRRVVNQNELVDGIKADEIDVDEHERNIFGPQQPESGKSY